MNLIKFLKGYKKNNYTYIIAEACDNHFGNIKKAKKWFCLLKKLVQTV